MTSFYLIRHGQKEAIPFDPPLTNLGIKQAGFTAELFKDFEFKQILASPKRRTQQTAEIIAKSHGLQVSTDPRLIERLEWEKDESSDEFIKRWSKTDIDRSYQPRDGLSSVANGVRIRKFLDEISQDVEESILLVTHGGTIGDLLRNIFGEANVPHVVDPITHAPHILISECSVTILKKDKSSYKLVKLNDTSHLSNFPK